MNKRKNNSAGYVQIKIYMIDYCFEMPFDRYSSSKIYGPFFSGRPLLSGQPQLDAVHRPRTRPKSYWCLRLSIDSYQIQRDFGCLINKKNKKRPPEHS